MKFKLVNKVSIVLLISSAMYGQYNGSSFAVSANFNYTTTSKIFLNPNSSDPVINSNHNDLDAIKNYSIEARYRISEPLIIGLSGEYIKKTDINSSMRLGGMRIDMNDGYEVYPIELTVYYLLPFSTERFKFLMGGGGGIYIGSEIRSIKNVSITNVSRKIGYGIQVAVGMDYLVKDYFAVRGQMRFRDPEFKMTSRYSQSSVVYNDRTIALPTGTFDTKVNIDGVTFSFGLVFIF